MVTFPQTSLAVHLHRLGCHCCISHQPTILPSCMDRNIAWTLSHGKNFVLLQMLCFGIPDKVQYESLPHLSLSTTPKALTCIGKIPSFFPQQWASPDFGGQQRKTSLNNPNLPLPWELKFPTLHCPHGNWTDCCLHQRPAAATLIL